MDSMNSIDERSNFRPVVFKKRWLILFILSWLNFVNGVLWISYFSISDKVGDFFNISLNQVNYLNLVYPAITILLCFPVIYYMDLVGLRATFIACSWLNLASASFRFVASDHLVSTHYRYPLAMAGQCFGAIAQPLVMFSPAKLAAQWFSSSERAMATTIGAMCNPLGVLVGSIVPPLVIKAGMFNLSIGILVLALIGALVATLGINKSSPPSPPSLSADRRIHQLSFIDQLRTCGSRRSFWLLALSFGVGMGVFSSLASMFQQMMCPFGYGDTFAGICGGILILAGLLGSAAAGWVADKTKRFTEICQVSLVLSTWGLIVFSVLMRMTQIPAAIALCVAWIGVSGISVYSIYLELAAEVTYPASENVSTGLLSMVGQIFFFVFMFLTQYLREDIQPLNGKQCVPGSDNQPASDYWIFNVFMSSISLISCCLMLFAFKAEYCRQAAERDLVSTQESFDTDNEGSMRG